MDLLEFIFQIRKYSKVKYLMMKQVGMEFIFFLDKDVNTKAIGKMVLEVVKVLIGYV